MSTMADVAVEGISAMLRQEDDGTVMLIVFKDGSMIRVDLTNLEIADKVTIN
jgi:hypothetical protein